MEAYPTDVQERASLPAGYAVRDINGILACFDTIHFRKLIRRDATNEMSLLPGTGNLSACQRSTN